MRHFMSCKLHCDSESVDTLMSLPENIFTNIYFAVYFKLNPWVFGSGLNMKYARITNKDVYLFIYASAFESLHCNKSYKCVSLCCYFVHFSNPTLGGSVDLLQNVQSF